MFTHTHTQIEVFMYEEEQKDYDFFYNHKIKNDFCVCVSIQSARCEELHLHAENLSRRVWELLMLLPTCPKMLQAFQNISDDTVSQSPLIRKL